MVAFLCAVILLGAEPERQVPDPSYFPRKGDDAILWGVDNRRKPINLFCGPEAADVNLLHDRTQMVDNGTEGATIDIRIVKGLLDSKKLYLVPSRTPVVITEFGKSPGVGPDRRTKLRPPLCRVEIQSGIHKGRLFYVNSYSVVRMIPVSDLESDPRAVTPLKTAQNLEKLGKSAAAVEGYRQIYIHYSISAEAEAAYDGIVRLKGKVPWLTELDPLPKQEEVATAPAEPEPRALPRRPRYQSQEAGRAEVEQAMNGMVRAFVAEQQQLANAEAYQQMMQQAARTHRCGARTLDGTQCQRFVRGSVYCYQHSGQ